MKWLLLLNGKWLVFWEVPYFKVVQMSNVQIITDLSVFLSHNNKSFLLTCTCSFIGKLFYYVKLAQ